MRAEIKKNGFKEIKTAVCYGKLDGNDIVFKYLPSPNTDYLSINDLLNHTSSSIQYSGNNEILTDNDFAQYGFSYLINKGKFNSDFLINELDNDTKNFLGKEVDILTAVENRICPSSITTDEECSYNFFGSSTFKNSRFYSFNLESGVYKLELYEEALEKNHNSNLPSNFYEYGSFDLMENSEELGDMVEPAIVITLGPDKKYRSNDSSWYYENDLLSRIGDVTNLIEYKKEFDELLFNKTINIYLLDSKSSDNINNLNISIETWKIDEKNPNRNTNKYLLRNDDFYDLVNTISPIQNKRNTDFIYDVNSMSLVSNSKPIQIDDCFILKKKISRYDPRYIRAENEDLYYIEGGDNLVLPEGVVIDNKDELSLLIDTGTVTSENWYLSGNNKNNYPNWSNYTRYNIGDRVSFNNLHWESLVENNIGNNPIISSNWEEINKLTNYFTTRLKVLFDETKYSNVGKIIPTNNFIINDNTSRVDISAVTEAGFDIISDYVLIYPPYRGLSELPMSQGGYNNYSYFTTQDLSHLFTFSGNDQINILRNIDLLFIKTEPKTYSINFNIELTFDGDKKLVSWENWEDNNIGLGLEIESFDKKYTIELNNEVFSFDAKTEDEVKLNLRETNKYKYISLITNQDEVLDLDLNKKPSFKISPNDKSSNKLVQTLRLEYNTFTLSIVSYDGFVVDKTQQKVVSDNPGYIRFYEETSTKLSKVIVSGNGKSYSITSQEEINSDWGKITLNSSDDIYTLSIDKIKTNLDITIVKQ